MADILFKAVPAVHVDPETNARACYKRGDPVVVKPTGWAWGAAETLPPNDGGKFFRVRLLRNDGVTPVWAVPNGWQPGDPIGDPPGKLAQIVGDPERSDLVFEGDLDEFDVPIGVIIRRRLWRVRADDLPTNVRNEIARTGLYEVTVAQVRNFIQNKKDGSTPAAGDLGE